MRNLQKRLWSVRKRRLLPKGTPSGNSGRDGHRSIVTSSAIEIKHKNIQKRYAFVVIFEEKEKRREKEK